MADLTFLESSSPVQITGGDELYAADVDAGKRLKVQGVACATASNTRPSVTNSSSVILASNANRKIAYIFNSSGAAIYFKLGATAVVGEGIKLNAGALYEIGANNLWTGDIMAIKSGASVNVEVFEGTY